MKVVCVASRHAVFELSAADLVVRSVNDLSVMNLKNLFAREDEEERLREQARAEELAALVCRCGWWEGWQGSIGCSCLLLGGFLLLADAQGNGHR